MADPKSAPPTRAFTTGADADGVTSAIPVVRSTTACHGAVAATLLRRIAFRAGAYAPGIQEQLFYQLSGTAAGLSFVAVQRWCERENAALHAMGYRVCARWSTEPTAAIAEWVRQGRGHRAALLSTQYLRLHPTGPAATGTAHAVGLCVGANASVVMIDPAVEPGHDDTIAPPDELPRAHKDAGQRSLKLFWVGWS